MKNIILVLLLLGVGTCFGQFHKYPKSTNHLYLNPITFETQTPSNIDFLQFQSIKLSGSPQFLDQVTYTNLFPVGRLNDEYWPYTSHHYLVDGILKATYTYDMLGNVKESQLSFSLKKKN